MQTKFINKQGWLSQYALACGYCEVNEGWKEQRKATLWRDSACWQVQALCSSMMEFVLTTIVQRFKK